jgi:hypothetical protein
MLDKKRVRDLNTLATLAMICGALGLLFNNQIMAASGVTILIIALFLPRISTFISDAWLAFAEKISKVMNHFVLSFTYFFVLTPFSFMQKVSNRKKKKESQFMGQTSFFVTRNHAFGAKDFEKPW